MNEQETMRDLFARIEALSPEARSRVIRAMSLVNERSYCIRCDKFHHRSDGNHRTDIPMSSVINAVWGEPA